MVYDNTGEKRRLVPEEYCMCRAACFSPGMHHIFIVGIIVYLKLVGRAVSRMEKIVLLVSVSASSFNQVRNICYAQA